MSTLDEDVWLVEVDAVDPDTSLVATLYFATRGHVTTPSETPASTTFDPRVKQALQISRTMFGPSTTQGRSTTGLGDVVLGNEDGLFDNYIDWGFDGQAITIRRGAVGAAYPGGFTTELVATMSMPEFTQTEVRLKLRDRQAEMAVPLQPAKFTGAGLGTLEGTSDTLAGKPKPVCYGTVYNVAPPCVETAKLIYQVADAELDSIDAVYDRGVSLQPNYVQSLLSVGPNGHLKYSTDHGDNWTTISGHGIGAPRGAAYGAGVWCVSTTSTGSGIYRSTDGGATWTQVLNTGGSSRPVWNIRYLNNTFVGVGTDRIYFSTDGGVTWTTIVVNNTTFSQQFQDIAYGVDRYVLVYSNTIYHSLDLKNWTSVSVSGAWRGITFATTAALFVMVGGGGTPIISTSPDGIGWTSRTVPVSHTAYQYNGVTEMSGTVVVIGQTAFAGTDALIASSTNGTTYTARTCPSASTPLYGVSNDGTYFVGVGSDGGFAFIRSTDGATWVNDTSPGGAENPGGGVTLGAGYGGSVATYANSTDLLDNSKAPPAGTFKPFLDAAGSYFRLGASPSGLVTNSATEGAAASDRTTAQVYKRILTDRAGLAGGEYSAGDLTTLDAADNSIIGFWTDQETLINTALDQVAGSLGASWFVDKTGVFRIKQLLTPSGSPVVSYVAADLKKPLTRVASNDPGQGVPAWQVIVRYAQNYTVQQNDVATSVSDARKAYIAKQWREATDSDASVQDVHALAVQLGDDSLLVDAADAAAEASRRLALKGVTRGFYEFGVEYNATNRAVEIADVIQLTHDRYGMSGGVLFRVLGIAPNAKEKMITFTGWGAP